jgi:membrane-associated phospholipid phosphatase
VAELTDAAAPRPAGPREGAQAAPLRGVTAIDRLFLAYLLVNTAFVLARMQRLGDWPWLLAGNACATSLVLLLARLPRSRLTTFVGGIYPLLLAPAFYSQVGLMHLDLAFVHDRAVQHWDQVLFGSQVSVTWHQRVPDAALSWVLHACYGSYYLIVPLVPLFLFFRRPAAAFERGIFILTLAEYGCYAAFTLFPVAGPRYFWGNAIGAATTVLPARIVRSVLEGGSAYGTAFPSSHVAAAWCAVYALWGAERRAALVLAPIALGLAFGTVYGQFHYGTDALAGAAAAVLLCVLADPLSRWLASSPRQA